MENNSYAYAETLDVLDNMNKIYVNKIPEKLIKYFKDNANTNYKKHIVPYKALSKQNLHRETLAILAMLNLKYWAKSEEHKQYLLKNSKNADKIENQFKDENDIFSKKQITSEKTEELAMTTIKNESIFTKIINWIKRLKER